MRPRKSWLSDPAYFISPSEPPLLRGIGTTSAVAELKGCDVYISLPEIRIGIQRKTWIDLVISLNDGRLAGSIVKMDMPVKILVIEGKALFDKDGHMVVRSRRAGGVDRGWARLRHTRESLAGVAISLRYVHGLDVVYTDSVFDTAAHILHIGSYFGKQEHKGIVGRRVYVRGTDRSGWGEANPADRARDRKVNFLMGLGIGQKTAENLLVRYNGRIPLKWDTDKGTLMTVPLVGETTADKLMKFFE